MPKYKGTAYRAMRIKEKNLVPFLKQHLSGKVVKYNYYVSCGSIKKATYWNKNRKNIRIKFEDVEDIPIISDFSDGIKFHNYPREELLIPRGREFKVKSINKTKQGYEITLISNT